MLYLLLTFDILNAHQNKQKVIIGYSLKEMSILLFASMERKNHCIWSLIEKYNNLINLLITNYGWWGSWVHIIDYTPLKNLMWWEKKKDYIYKHMRKT